MTKLQPIVAFDVDGVLNIFDINSSSYLKKAEISIPPEGVPVSPFLRVDPEGGIHGTVIYNPEHGVWINSLIERGVKCVWATTWEKAANYAWPKLLEIPELELGVDGDVTPRSGIYRSSSDWKAAALLEKYPNPEQPLVWIDDWATGGLDFHRKGNTLTVRTNPYKGLQLEDINEVEEFLKL